MDIQPQTMQTTTDDQELAKVLAGINNETDDSSVLSDAAIPAAPTTPPPAPEANPSLDEAQSTEDVSLPEMPEIPQPAVAPVDQAPITQPTPLGDNELDSVKSEAINELRPLVDKLELSPEDKFDTYLLLIRSTDDKTLIAPAHETAKQIVDDTRRAQALLDIIKEIDFLSNHS